MPIYEYQCACGKKFSDLDHIANCSVPKPCPECGAMAQRIISPTKMLAYVGSYKYDKINNFFPGTSASDYKNGVWNKATEDW